MLWRDPRRYSGYREDPVLEQRTPPLHSDDAGGLDRGRILRVHDVLSEAAPDFHPVHVAIDSACQLSSLWADERPARLNDDGLNLGL
jgi:hypothetical protein